MPKFIFKWIKETSATGYLRSGQTPNRRTQDGYKEYWLCGECEDRFQKWETEFADEMFYPLTNNSRNTIIYKDWFLKFVVSISWRALLYSKEYAKLSHFSSKHLDAVDHALGTWQSFLLGKIKHPGKYEQHVITTKNITNAFLSNMPKNINMYLQRSVQIDPVADEKQSFIFVKIPYLIFIGGINLLSEQWKNTKIHVHKGRITEKKCLIPKGFLYYLTDKARELKEIQNSMSEKQKNKINETALDNPLKAITSETYKNHLMDKKLKNL